MPIIRVLNWPSLVAAACKQNAPAPAFHDFGYFLNAFGSDERFKYGLAKVLKEAVLSAQVPGIESLDLVTVSFDTGSIDEVLLIIVEGLFDRPERTIEIRLRLASMLQDAVLKFTTAFKLKVEVLVHRFDPVVEAYLEPKSLTTSS